VRLSPTNTARGAVLRAHPAQSCARVRITERRFLVGIGLRLKEERERIGLTQEDLAERIGTDSRSLQRIESGFVNISVVKLLTLATSVRVTPQALLAKPDPRTKRRAGRPKKTR